MARGGDAPHDAVEPQVVPDVEDDDVVRSPPRKKTTASTRIRAAVKGARARLQELQDAVDNRRHAVTEENLRLQYEDAHKYAVRIFEAVTVGLEGEPVTAAHLEVEAAAKKLWRAMLDHNRGLQASSAATAKKAQEEEEAHARERMEEAEKRLAAEEAAAAVAKEQARANARAASMAGCDFAGIYGGAYNSTPLRGHTRSVSDHIGTMGPSSFGSGLFRSRNGGIGSNGSTSVGNGYTVDRNGRFHDSRGRLAKNPYK